jgi:Tol biopolymer transport system component
MRALAAAAALASLVLGHSATPRPESIAWGHGREIAFTVAHRGIFVVDPATGAVRRLTAIGGDGADAGAWSPDGATLAFSDGARLYTVRSDGSELRTLGRGFFPSWSRDGRRLAFFRPGGLFISHANGTGDRFVARDRYGDGAGPAAWSPDDRRLAYVLCSAAYLTPPCEHGYGFDVYTVGADARVRRRISPKSGNPQCVDWSRTGLLAWQDGGKVTLAGPRRRRTLRLNGCPVWSPDGRTAALASGPFGPLLVSANSLGVRQLHVLRHRSFALGEVAWSPDGRQLAYLSGGHLYVVGADGRGARKVL